MSAYQQDPQQTSDEVVTPVSMSPNSPQVSGTRDLQSEVELPLSEVSFSYERTISDDLAEPLTAYSAEQSGGDQSEIFQPMDAGVEPQNLTIPTIREREKGGGDVVSDIFSRIYDDGTIFLAGPIEDGIATLVSAQLMYLQAKDPEKPITIHLNSPGGVVTSGLSIYDTIQQIANPVTIAVSGKPASMGAVILSGGEPGRRFAQPNASIMIHSIRGGTGGVAADIQRQGERLVKLNERLTRIIAENCGQPFNDVFEDMRQDHFMTAEEALEYGIIDGILQPDGTVLTLAELKKDEMN